MGREFGTGFRRSELDRDGVGGGRIPFGVE